MKNTGHTVLLLCLFLCLTGCKLGPGERSSRDLRLVNVQTVNLEGIENITVSYLSEDIRLIPHSKSELTLKEYMNRNKAKIPTAVKREDTKLSVTGTSHPSSDYRGKIEIYLPRGYSRHMEVFTESGDITAESHSQLGNTHLKTDSGNIGISEIGSQRIRLETASGNIEALGLRAWETDIDTVSGNIKVVKTSCERIGVTSTSGHIGIAGAAAVQMKMETATGNLLLENAAGQGNFSTTSGNMTLDFASPGEQINASSASGNILLLLPENMGFHYKFDTESDA